MTHGASEFGATSSTAPWDLDAFETALGFARRVGTPPQALVGMLLSESDGYPGPNLMHGLANHHVNAVGLNQILLAHLPDVGWRGRWEDYEALSVTEQLLYVERWVLMRPGPKDTAARLYLSNFLPGYWQHGGDPSFILCGVDTHPQWYFPNWPAFDPWLTKKPPPGIVRRGEKGYITVSDLATRIDRKLAEPRGRAFAQALQAAMGPPTPAPGPTEAQVTDELQQVYRLPPDIDTRVDPPDPDKMGSRKT